MVYFVKQSRRQSSLRRADRQFFSGCVRMVFSSLTFLLYFFPIVLALYFVRSSVRWRNGVLLAASLFFYAWGEPTWILAMLASALINYFCALAMRGQKGPARRLWLYIGAGSALALLFVFKYLSFFVNAFLGIFSSAARIPVLELPIGISFYTFQILTYTVDVYRGKQKPQPSFARLLLYVSCFPQLIAGPIVRYGDISKEISSRITAPDDFSEGMRRFAVGLGKKVLVANVCAEIMNKLPLAGAAELSLGGAWYAAAIYTLQLYFDFSGYSDMAIGLGRMFGFHYKENFDHPYWSASVREFWRRWHISLGSFFREYVYIPLGGNRGGIGKTIRNTLIVWGLTGLWHGANWTFILWGLYYGALLTIDLSGGKKLVKVLPGAVNRLITLALVMIGWVIFYYPSLGQAFSHLGAMFGFGKGLMDESALEVIKTYSVLPAIYFILSLPVGEWFKNLTSRLNLNPRIGEVTGALVMAALVVYSVIFIEGLSSNPFIYFQF